MKDRKKRNLTIGILCFLLVFMGVGFAVMNATLNINGTATAINTWDVRMTNIEVIEKSEGATNEEETKINDDGVTAIFKTDFTKPGDFITYQVTIENKGSIDAVLNDISITLNVSEADKDLFNIIDTRPNNQLLEAGTSTTFTIKVEFRSDADRMPSGDIEYTVKVDYSQQTGEIPDVEEDWIFKVDETGTIVAYNYEKGTDVVIPAEVDGVKIKKINSISFLNDIGNVLYFFDSSGEAIVVIKDEENFDDIKEKVTESETFATNENNYYRLSELENLDYSSYIQALSLNVSLDSALTGDGAITMNYPNVTLLDLSDANNLETIEMSSFLMAGINQIIFNDNQNLKEIGEGAFFGNNLTGTLVIPEGVTTIGRGAFNVNNLTRLTLPSTLTYVGDDSFVNNPIEEVTIKMTETEFLQKTGNITFVDGSPIVHYSEN